MSEELLPWYERELAWLRRHAEEFARAYPKIAARLAIAPDAVEDPHVARLIESVAFLNARIRRKLDDEFPELAEGLLALLDPQAQAPVPSLAIVELVPEKGLTVAAEVAAGTAIETERIDQQPCRFRTCYPVSAWPIAIEEARLQPAPVAIPPSPRASGAASALSLRLRSTSPAGFAKLAPKSLRFFLKGEARTTHALYELLLRDALEVSIASGPKDKRPAVLPKSAIRPVGFAPAEALLPRARAEGGGRALLREYFAFPHKFLFIDIDGLPAPKLAECGATLEIHVPFSVARPHLEDAVRADTFALGCTPIVNLFPLVADPIQLAHVELELHVVCNRRHPLSFEVFSIDSVVGVDPDGTQHVYNPFFGLDHGGGEGAERRFWHALRRPAPEVSEKLDHGTEVFLRLVDLDFTPQASDDRKLRVSVTCTNRDLPSRLRFSTDEPRLQLAEGGGPIQKIRALTAPTRPVRPRVGRGAIWPLVSLYATDQLSIAGSGGADGLREILRLSDPAHSRANEKLVEGIVGVRGTPAVMRVLSGGQPGVVRGTDVAVEIDETRFAGAGPYLFGCVLERFIAACGALNSWTRLALESASQRDETEHARPRAKDERRKQEIHRWPARSGDKALV